ALAKPGRQVLEPRDLHLQPRLARPGVAMKDLEDDRGAVEDVDAGGALEVALLGRREVVINEHDLGTRRRLRRIGPDRLGLLVSSISAELVALGGLGLGSGFLVVGVPAVGVLVVGILVVGILVAGVLVAGLAATGLCVGGHDAGAAGPLGELEELAFPEHDAGGEAAAALGQP